MLVFHVFFFLLFIFVEPGLALFCVATCDCASEEFVSVVKCNVVCQFVFASFTFNLVGFVCFGSNQLNTFLSILTADKLLAFFSSCFNLCEATCMCRSQAASYSVALFCNGNGKQIKKLHVWVLHLIYGQKETDQTKWIGVKRPAQCCRQFIYFQRKLYLLFSPKNCNGIPVGWLKVTRASKRTR